MILEWTAGVAALKNVMPKRVQSLTTASQQGEQVTFVSHRSDFHKVQNNIKKKIFLFWIFFQNAGSQLCSRFFRLPQVYCTDKLRIILFPRNFFFVFFLVKIFEGLTILYSDDGVLVAPRLPIDA